VGQSEHGQVVQPTAVYGSHAPRWQKLPGPQTTPGPPVAAQPPQWNKSLFKSATHCLPHAVVPGGQELRHAPLPHTWFGPQTVPHAPQFSGSSSRFLQETTHPV
jgi:hypothetical protein